MKIIKKYPDARLETCGQKKPTDHRNGCYLKLNNNNIFYSDDSIWCVIDFDKDNKIIGIEFVDGLKGGKKKYGRKSIIKN